VVGEITYLLISIEYQYLLPHLMGHWLAYLFACHKFASSMDTDVVIAHNATYTR
jgi:hypothetical protein